MSDDQRRWIEAARAATGARSVRLHVLPVWARRAIRGVAKARGIECDASILIDATLAALRDSGQCPHFDHWGTSKIERHDYAGPSLVTEPYAVESDYAAAIKFAEILGAHLEIGMASWWYPSNTTRFEFWPRSEGDQP